ncbi:peptidase inhibitor family I36 protein [Streptomyces sp. NPDC048506]|uniref:peptidase inhibitor family I36 protein n=1 Tax=Streptomyces sp. NPDC048506 TaxID=3155028 RepID=UPI003443FF43
MNTRQRIALTAAAAAVSGGLALAPAAGAVAAPTQAKQASASTLRAPSNCPRGYLCVYPEANYKGTPKKVQRNNDDLRHYGGAFNLPLSAYNNGTRCSVTVWEKPHHGGNSAKLNRGTGWKFIGGNLMTIYSNKWC